MWFSRRVSAVVACDGILLARYTSCHSHPFSPSTYDVVFLIHAGTFPDVRWYEDFG